MAALTKHGNGGSVVLGKLEKATVTAAQRQERLIKKYAKKMAFSKFVKSKEKTQPNGDHTWECCSETFSSVQEFHKHVSLKHASDIAQRAQDIVNNGAADAKWRVLSNNDRSTAGFVFSNEKKYDKTDDYPWFPLVDSSQLGSSDDHDGQVLLYYTYRDIENPEDIRKWQEALCERLELTGKVRVAREGLNVTVAGNKQTTEIYIKAVMSHPLFEHMKYEDFKKSPGLRNVFPDGLKVGVYEEVVPMGVSPDEISYKDAGKLLSPEEFHESVQKYLNADQNERDSMVFVDCRNFYESNIGKFVGAVTPDIRKFSYWPEYVEANRDFYADKKIYMYCTGGIRCERGSAYLRKKGIGSEVYQLSGGIHKYIEKFPDGYFRGKLFVFDDRYAIHSNEDVISECKYCRKPWDRYSPCSSSHCHQLVLSCPDCRDEGHTACCNKCQASGVKKEECECTRSRPRIPRHCGQPSSSHGVDQSASAMDQAPALSCLS